MVIGKINPPPPINPRPQGSQPPAPGPKGPTHAPQGPQPSTQAPRGPQQTAPTQQAPQTQQTARQTPLRQTGRGQLRPTTPSARLSQQQQMTSTATEQRLTSLITSKPVIQTGPQPQLQALKKHEQHLKPKSETHESRELEQEEDNSPSSVKEKDKPRESEKAPELQQDAPKQQEKLQDVQTPQPREQQERDPEGGRGRQQQRQQSKDDSEPGSETPDRRESSEPVPLAPPLAPRLSQPQPVVSQRPMPKSPQPLDDHQPTRDLGPIEQRREQVTRQQKQELKFKRGLDQRTLGITQQPRQNVSLAREVDTGKLVRGALRPSPDWKGLVGAHFGKLEQQLRSTLRQDTRDQLYTQASFAGRALFSASLDQPGTMLLQALSGREQLREIFAREIGNLRPDKYQSPSYTELSDRKRELVDRMVEGFEAARDESLRRPQLLGPLQAHATTVAAQQVASVLASSSPHSDEVFSLTLKSRDGLLPELAVGLGLTSKASIETSNQQDQLEGRGGPPSWLTRMPPAQRQLLEGMADSILQSIGQNLPNRPSQNTVSLSTSKGNLDVPASITLNGVSYANPVYLAKGGLGLILEYTDQSSGKSVVVKSLLDKSQHENMAQELTAHRHAMGGENGKGHPNLVPLQGVVRGDDGTLYMVMDKAGGGDLHRTSRSLAYAAATGLPPRAQIALIQSFMQDALQGMQHLQDRNMMHLDVKPLNFLLSSTGQVMVSDLGSAQRSSRIEDSNFDVPTTYRTPEWNQEKSQKSDIFQLGVTLRAMLTGHQVGEQRSGELGAMHELINAMVDPDPRKRPTLEALQQHSFLRDVGHQDPAKIAALKTALIDYSAATGKPLQALLKEVSSLQEGIKRQEQAYALNDPAGAPNEERRRYYENSRANISSDLQNLRQQLSQTEARLAQINQDPQVKPKYQALLQAASGLL